MTLFSLHNESLAYGKQPILTDISLAINAGETVALVGPSGAGKTSLLNVLYQQHREQTAFCPQDSGLVDILSVYHNIYMGQLERHCALYNLWNLAFPIERHRKAIARLAEELGIDEKLKHSVDQLSGGQRQRVALGRALYRQQSIFLGDEPVVGLDPLQAERLLAHLIKQHETVVVSLHNSRLALKLFSRVIGIKSGKLAFDLPSKELNSNDLDSFYAQ